MALGDRRMDRQQLDRGDAELDQVVDHRRGGERGERAALGQLDRRMLDREAAHMHLEDDCLLPRSVRMMVVVPAEGSLDDAAFRHLPRAVAAVEGEVFARAADAIAVHDIAPAQLPGQRLGIGVEQQLVGVEAVAG